MNLVHSEHIDSKILDRFIDEKILFGLQPY